MKKFLSFLLVAVMLFSMSACTIDEEVRGTVGSDPNAEETFSLGTTESNRYHSEFLGLSCTLPSEWVFYTDEEILELNNIVAGAMDEDVAAAIENADLIYDMYASNPNDYSSVNINLEKHTVLEITAINLKASLEAQFAAIKSTYENMGYTNVQIRYEKITVDGRELDAAVITAEIAGLTFNATAFCFKKGRYLANVSVSAFGADNVNTILSYFDFD